MKKRTIVALATSILLTVNTPATLATQVPADDSTSISTESTLANGKAVTEENVLELLRQIEKDWPTGTVWGTRKTPGTHKNEVPCAQARKVMNAYRVSETYGCSGYASMVSSLIFGDEANPARRLEDLEQIRPGDIIFMVRSETGKVWHVAVALESPNEKNAFHITDGNAGETVQWPDRETPTAETTWTATVAGTRATIWRSGPGTLRACPTPETVSWAGPPENKKKPENYYLKDRTGSCGPSFMPKTG